MELEFGDVVLVPFPFTDQRTTKKRPAVIVSARRYNLERQDVIIAAVTSQGITSSFDVTISAWQEAGLVTPSTIKPVVTTVEKTLIIKSLGRLLEADRAKVPRMLSAILGGTTGPGII